MSLVQDVLCVQMIEVFLEGGDGFSEIHRATFGRHDLVHPLQGEEVADDRESKVRVSGANDVAQ
jgi:hypothetical protein